MSFNDARQMFDRMSMNAKRAKTYLRKSEALFSAYRQVSPCAEPSVDYWHLLDQALWTALFIVERLPDSFFETTVMDDLLGVRGDAPSEWSHSMSDGPLEQASKIASLIERRRAKTVTLTLIRKLESTAGRTPEEREAYLAKARELRAKIEVLGV